ncbi:unnamed protein product, partial [Staurois parvus]
SGHSALLCRRTCSSVLPVPWSSGVLLSPAVFSPRHRHLQCGSAVSGHLLYYVRSLWSSPVLCPQSLVVSCTMSVASGHLLYYVSSLWSSPVVCPQPLVISCTMSAVSGHLLYYVSSLWSSPVVCPQSLVISCTMSAVIVHGHHSILFFYYKVNSAYSYPKLIFTPLGHPQWVTPFSQSIMYS